MTEKYIDLTNRIRADIGGNLALTVSILRWLDRNPGQVPGRTITERVKITDTEAYELYESAKSFSLDDFKLALESIDGIETVDDPEPTNAEKLKATLDEIGSSTKGYREWLAEQLDEAGVKAPGGDE